MSEWLTSRATRRRSASPWLLSEVRQKMTFVAFLPYLVATTAAGTLIVALWSLQWPRVRGTIDISIFDQEWEPNPRAPKRPSRRRGKRSAK